MKICAMCGKKMLKSMIPFTIVAAKGSKIDSCGRCFMLTRINDLLISIKESSDGGSKRSGIQVPH
jgi:ribosome-binding protein aMBF1 (putative translation factor)